MLKKVEDKCKRCRKEFCRKRTAQDYCSAQCRKAAWSDTSASLVSVSKGSAFSRQIAAVSAWTRLEPRIAKMPSVAGMRNMSIFSLLAVKPRTKEWRNGANHGPAMPKALLKNSEWCALQGRMHCQPRPCRLRSVRFHLGGRCIGSLAARSNPSEFVPCFSTAPFL